MIDRLRKIGLYVSLFSLIFNFIAPIEVLAVDVDFYSSNDILFYNPEDTCGTDSGNALVTSSKSVSLTKNATLEKIFQLLINGGMNAVQTAAVMGNMYAESSFRSDAVEKGNNIGYGLAQWSFGRRDALEAYAAKKGVPVSSIDLQIEFLLLEYNKKGYKTRLDKTSFKDTNNIASATKDWMMIFEAPRMSPANDPARLNSKRIPAAEKIYGFYKDLAPSGSATIATTDNSCASSDNGAVAGDIVSTALNFALDKPAKNGTNQASQAKPAYIDALSKYNKGANPADCGIFVATVMMASGVDPKYPKSGTANQLAYVKSHTEKYKIIESPTRSDLQPGDIVVVNNDTDHHTLIYTGNSPYPTVDASQDQRVPSVRTEGSLWLLRASGVVIARVIK